MPLHVDYEVRWKNYRAFKDTDWITIRPLTILIGPNNSGKTSIISPLLLMSQTMSSRDAVTPLVTRGPLINAGSFKDIVHNRDPNGELFLGFRFHAHDANEKTEKVGEYPPGAAQVTLSTGGDEEIHLKKYELFDIYKRRLLSQSLRTGGKYSLTAFRKLRLKKTEITAIRESDPVNFLFTPTRAMYELGKSKKGDRTRRALKFSDDFSLYMSSISLAFQELRNIFSTLSYIGPLRERPRRYYEKAGEIARSVGGRGQHMANMVRRGQSDFGGELDKWIRRFEFGDRLKVDNIGDDFFSLSFFRRNPRTLTNIADAGFGASQLLPLVVQALAAEKDSLTIAEQPEIHLNPRLQCVLADLFAEMVNKDQRVIVETHSEHLLLRIRALVASGELDHARVAIYFVEKSGEESTVRQVPLKKNGHIESASWPVGFFDETLRGSLALAAAQSKSNHKKD